MKNIWLSSDHHFWHDRIRFHCQRDFSSVEEMNEKLIENWNRVVNPQDTVYYLGDFSFGNLEQTQKIFNRLAGNKALVVGNHDELKIHKKLGWAWIKDYYELKIDNKLICMFHYPMRSWNGSYHGSYAAHGHSHSTLPPFGRSRDVGVDACNYFPLHLDQFISSFSHLDLHQPSDIIPSKEPNL